LGVPKNYTGEKTEFVPFSFQTTQREQERIDRSYQQRKPFLVIDLVIAPGKKVKIPLYTLGEKSPPNEEELIVKNIS
jgi:hypothetical protein